MATIIEACVISVRHNVSAVSCSSWSILVLCWHFTGIYLYGVLNICSYFSCCSFCPFTLIFLIIVLFFIVHCLVCLEAKILFLLWTTGMACSFDLLLQNTFMESGFTSASFVVIMAVTLCYTDLMPLSHEVS